MSEDAVEKSKQRMQELLKDLKSDYLVRLPGKIEILKTLTLAQDWPQLDSEYHKLKGTGKTYGFPEVSIICERLESLALRDFEGKLALYESALSFLEKLHQAYLENKAFDMKADPFCTTLLALKID